MLVRRFPLGVLSQNGQVAYIGDELPDVIAVDVASGAVQWRTACAGRPIAASAEHVVIARVIDDHVVELSLLNAADGKVPAATPIRLSFPQWVAITLKPGREFVYRCEVKPPELTFEWHASQQYQGGAPPSTAVLERNARADAGVFHIDLDTALVRAEPRAAGAFTDDEADVVVHGEAAAREACAHGTRVYYLADRTLDTASGRTTLCAADHESGAIAWQLAIRDWQVTRPRTLRP